LGFSFCGLALVVPVYTLGVLRGALRFLYNLLTYQKKKRERERERERDDGDLRLKASGTSLHVPPLAGREREKERERTFNKILRIMKGRNWKNAFPCLILREVATLYFG
jgi:hypothetical protein